MSNSQEIKSPIEENHYQLYNNSSIKIANEFMQVTAITNMLITKKINSHSHLKLDIELNSEGKSLSEACGGKIEIIAYSKIGTEEKRTIFYGIITNICLKKEKAVIEALSLSVLLDEKNKNITYQNYKLDGEEIYKEIIKNSGQESNTTLKIDKNAIKGAGKEELSIQYQETDWEFIIRTASKINIPVMIKDAREKEKDGKTEDEDIGIKLILGYYDENDQNVNKGKLDFENDKVFYDIRKKKEKEIINVIFNGFHNVGEYLEIKDKQGKYIIKKALIKYSGNILTFEYILEKKSDYKIDTLYNPEFGGKSFIGVVSEVGKEETTLGKVKIDFAFSGMIEEKGKQGNSWIECSTIYGGGKTGAFIMPEINDSVAIYFPDNLEKNCYVTSALRGVELKRKNSEIVLNKIDPVYHNPDMKSIIVGDENGTTGIIISKPDKHVKIAGTFADTGKNSTVYLKVKDSGIDIVGEEKKNIKIKMDKEVLLIQNGESVIEMKNSSIVMKVKDSSSIVIDENAIAAKVGNTSIAIDKSGVAVKAAKFSSN